MTDRVGVKFRQVCGQGKRYDAEKVLLLLFLTHYFHWTIKILICNSWCICYAIPCNTSAHSYCCRETLFSTPAIHDSHGITNRSRRPLVLRACKVSPTKRSVARCSLRLESSYRANAVAQRNKEERHLTPHGSISLCYCLTAPSILPQ